MTWNQSRLDIANTVTFAGEVRRSGVATAGLADGDFGYLSGPATMSKTNAAAEVSSRVFGANEGVAGEMTTGAGSVVENAKFTTDGGQPGNGAPIWLAAGGADAGTGAGKLTATKPAAPNFVSEVGTCANNANYAALKTCAILLQPKVIYQAQ